MPPNRPFPRQAYLWIVAQGVVAFLGGIGLVLDPPLARWVVPYTLTAISLSLLCTASALPHPAARWLRERLRALFERPASAALIGLALLLFWLRGLWADRVINLPPLRCYLPLALLWPWLALAYLVSISDPARHRLKPVLRGVALLMFWVAIITLMLEVLLRVAYPWLPARLRQTASPALLIVLPLGHTIMMPPQVPIHDFWWAGQTEHYVFQPKDGDLFAETCLHTLPADEAPLPVDFQYDSHGFRGDRTDHVDLVVVGDSFVQAHAITTPFWQGLAPSVYALGAAGTGSLEQALLFDAYGPARTPHLVLMVYFEGNDLQDNLKFNRARQQYAQHGRNPLEYNSQFRPLDFSITYDTLAWLQTSFKRADGDCPFPVTDRYGHRMGYHPSYLGMFTLDPDDLRHSEVFALTRASIRETAAQARDAGAAFVLVFMPSKEHAHWPGLVDQIDQLAAHFPALKLTADGFVPDQDQDDPAVIAALARQHVDNQRTLLAELADQEGLLFLDLTPVLQQATADGDPVYFYGDTHLNPRGNDVIREALRQFFAANGLDRHW